MLSLDLNFNNQYFIKPSFYFFYLRNYAVKERQQHTDRHSFLQYNSLQYKLQLLLYYEYNETQ